MITENTCTGRNAEQLIPGENEAGYGCTREEAINDMIIKIHAAAEVKLECQKRKCDKGKCRVYTNKTHADMNDLAMCSTADMEDCPNGVGYRCEYMGNNETNKLMVNCGCIKKSISK